MTEISNELLANLLMEINGKLGQRLQNIESFMLAIGQEIERVTRTMEALEEARAQQVGQMLSEVKSARTVIHDLSDVEFNVTSPANEDGIIDWLASHVEITARCFVELGAGDFKHGICRFLAAHRNWKGVLFESVASLVSQARQDDFYRRHNLSISEAQITAETVNGLIEGAEFTGPVGLLSINAGGNEFWVWSGLSVVLPDIVVCAFNPVFGDQYAITIPYNPYFVAREAHDSGYYTGASIRALRELGQDKGYEFLGTNAKGTSAFFVREDLADAVLPMIKARNAFPARGRNPGDPNEELQSMGGISRLGLIKDLPVFDVAAGKTVRIGDLKEPYSEGWKQGMS